MAVPGVAARAMSPRARVPGPAAWGVPGGAVPGARAHADHSGVARAGTGETACGRGQPHASAMAGLDGGRAVAMAAGRGRGAPAEPRARLGGHGGDGPAAGEAAGDVPAACRPGVAGAMPDAAQAAGRLRVTRPLSRAADLVGRRGRGGCLLYTSDAADEL